MISMSFRDYLNEAVNKTAVMTFGRFNPPTIGHEKLFRRMKEESLAGSKLFIFVSQTKDSKKNPLEYSEKIQLMKEMFPYFSDNIVEDKSIRTVIDAVKYVESKKCKNLRLFFGSDRIDQMQTLVEGYNGKEYQFDSIEVSNAGIRDPDADDARGISASKMRQAALDNDFKTFKRGLPSDYKNANELFDTIKEELR